jgi:hypothetical protein
MEQDCKTIHDSGVEHCCCCCRCCDCGCTHEVRPKEGEEI